MKRLLSLWFPNWPIQRLLAVEPDWHHSVLVLYARDARRGQVVVACSRQAAKRGIQVGMPLAEATAILERHPLSTSKSYDSQQTSTLPARSSSGKRPGRGPASATPSIEPLDRLRQFGCLPHDASADEQRMIELARWCEAFSPRVGLDSQEPVQGLQLDITGIAIHFGGETSLAERLLHQLRQQGFWASVGIADTLGAAWALARFGPQRKPRRPHLSARPRIHIASADETFTALRSLPIEALRFGCETVRTLHELGIERIEQLATLPRDGLQARLGPEVLQRLDQATGLLEEVWQVVQEEPLYQVEWSTEHPSQRRDTLCCAVEHLSHQLTEHLLAQQQGAQQVECAIEYESGSVDEGTDHEPTATAEQRPRRTEWIHFSLALFRPCASAPHLNPLLQGQLERIQIPGPFVRVILTAKSVVKTRARQSMLWDELATLDGKGDSTELVSLIDRLSNRLGSHVVCAARLRSNPLPELAYTMLPLTGPHASPARMRAGLDRDAPQRDHRPLQLFSPPLRIDVRQTDRLCAFRCHNWSRDIDRTWGPERFETSWWQGPSVRRDYYRVHCTQGDRYWLFYDLSQRLWYLHGVFA